MVLNGINIRSGLELEVPVAEIFNVNVAPEGNILAKQCFSDDGKIKDIYINDIHKYLEKDPVITYSDIKIPTKINETLTCFVFDSYFVYQDDFGSGKLECEKNVELLFINNKMLDFNNFCANLMAAQSFTGNFEKPQFNHHFMGVGNFDFSEYIPLHELVVHSTLNLISFFVFYKKVLSSIGYFVCGLYENDIKEQRKYLTEQEYKSLISVAKKQKRNVMNLFKEKDDPEMGGLF